MRKYIDSFGKQHDLDDPQTYVFYPDDCDVLDKLMFKDIGFALVYYKYFHPDSLNDITVKEQMNRIDKLIETFCKDRKNNYKNILWYKEQLFLFQDEIENMC